MHLATSWRHAAALCFEQGLAAESEVVGCENKEDYGLLARFPS